jgi:hypothetical protein
MNLDYSNFTKQIVDFQKMAFTNWISATTMVQDHTTSAVNTILNQNAWIPEQGRKAAEEWMGACQQEQVRFKNLVEKSFSSVEQLLSQGKAPRAAKAKKQKA